ncbi:hypothetical protein EVAR_4831_1 [Eumeta japonica]|uniref:Uncharacterized protein n=1 Tax=Eumeta variegata TaxID=151549 RepID=A0A4C1SZS6_EUMVA|nr:hypothetical protein EVAR_4831_1 [Eumeta japonica]
MRARCRPYTSPEARTQASVDCGPSTRVDGLGCADTTISTWRADSDADVEAAVRERPHSGASCVQVVEKKHDGRVEHRLAECELPAPAQCECAPCRRCAAGDAGRQSTARPIPSAGCTRNYKSSVSFIILNQGNAYNALIKSLFGFDAGTQDSAPPATRQVCYCLPLLCNFMQKMTNFFFGNMNLASTARMNKKTTCGAQYAMRGGRFRVHLPIRRPPPRSRPASASALTPPQRHPMIDPERIEVYYFECGSGGGHLATTDAAPVTRTGNWLARVERFGVRLFAEVLAVPQLVAALPLALLLQLQRSALVCVRGVLVGSVQTYSDYLLKPVLAVTFNALLRPPLVCAGHTFAACRDALRPIAALLADYVDPAVRLVSAMALVRVHDRCVGCRILGKPRRVPPCGPAITRVLARRAPCASRRAARSRRAHYSASLRSGLRSR